MYDEERFAGASCLRYYWPNRKASNRKRISEKADETIAHKTENIERCKDQNDHQVDENSADQQAVNHSSVTATRKLLHSEKNL